MYIYVRNQFEGYHRWKDAPEEVIFLRSPHRHIFKLKTSMQVYFEDRDVEFFMLQHQINNILDCWKNLDTLDWSCELMATTIVKELTALYPNRFIECDVSEDGENGAVVNSNDI